jgi:hypothetical protein
MIETATIASAVVTFAACAVVLFNCARIVWYGLQIRRNTTP